MAFKQGNNPLSRKASPMRMSPFTKQEPSMSMDELEKMSAAQDAASKEQALQLPQIEGPGSPDYEAKTTMTYPGGEEGADYDEEGTNAPGRYSKKEKGMSRHTTEHSTEEYMDRKDAAIKKSKGMSRKASPLDATRAERRIAKTKDKASEAKEKAAENKSAESNQRNRAKAKRLDKRAERQENRAERKEKRKSKKAKLSKANRGVAVTSVGSVKSSGIKKDVKSSDADVQDSTRAKVKKSLA